MQALLMMIAWNVHLARGSSANFGALLCPHVTEKELVVVASSRLTGSDRLKMNVESSMTGKYRRCPWRRASTKTILHQPGTR